MAFYRWFAVTMQREIGRRHASSASSRIINDSVTSQAIFILYLLCYRRPHPYAVRLYSGKLELMETQTIEVRRYWLLNLPYFLAGRLNDYIGWMVEQLADKRRPSASPGSPGAEC